MRDLRELSKLPHDQAYWDRLESRAMGQWGSGEVGQMGGWADGWMGGNGWLAPFARNAAALGGLAIAAGIAALLLVPPRTRGGTNNPTVLFRLPADPAMAAFLASPTPPSLASLMASLSRSEP